MEFVSYQDFLFFIKDKADEALQIVLILAGGGLLIRAVRILADRLVKFVGDDDPLTTNQREQRAVTLAGIFKSVSKIVIVLVAGRGWPRCDSWRGARLPMKPLNAQRTLYRAFPTRREALPMLEELKESIDAIALDGKWQQRFRVGIEGSLSVLVRRHSLRRARLKRWDGFQRHVPLGVIGMNLLRLLDWEHRQQGQAAA